MNFDFTGRHIDVTPALRLHVEEHFKKINHLFDGKSAKAHVIIEVERGRHRSEIVINWRSEVLTANSANFDMYLSLSQTIAKIEKQARRLKDKIIDKSHKARKRAAVSSPVEQSEKFVRPRKIVVSDTMASKPMTAEEAAIDLEYRNDQFLVFHDATGGGVSVIFRRKDGHYGLIQP